MESPIFSSIDSPSLSILSLVSSPMILSPLRSPTSCFTEPPGDYDSTVLAMAILRGDLDTVVSFVGLGATISERHHWTLYQACLVGVSMVEALLACPDIAIKMSSPDENHDTILHFVLRTPSVRFGTNKPKIVKLLAEHGADCFQPDRLGETALHILAGVPGEDEIEMLEDMVSGSGPVPHLNDQNIYGDTALIVAVLCNNVGAVKLLLDVGAEPNIQGEHGIVATQYALQQGNLEILALLTNAGGELVEEMAVDED
ncbi:unnamed protein product [Discula destructiva]